MAGTLQKEDGGEKAIYYLTKKIRMFSNLINLIDLLPNHVNNVASYILVNGVFKKININSNNNNKTTTTTTTKWNHPDYL